MVFVVYGPVKDHLSSTLAVCLQEWKPPGEISLSEMSFVCGSTKAESWHYWKILDKSSINQPRQLEQKFVFDYAFWSLYDYIYLKSE